MRKLVWFTLGFSGACLLFGLMQQKVIWLPVLLAAASVLLLVPGKRWKRIRPLSVTLLGMAVGLFWTNCFAAVYLQPARAMDGKTASQRITITDYSRPTEYGTAAEGRLEGKPYRLLLYLKEEQALEPGDQVSGSFLFRYTGRNGLKESPFHQGKSIWLTAKQSGRLTVLPNAEHNLTIWASRLRRGVTDLLDRVFPPDTAPIAQALLLGQTRQMDYGTDLALQISGIRHVVAVSGLHVSILFSVIFLMSLHNRWLTPALGIPVLVLFAALAGFSPSVVRAGIMYGLLMLALLFQREYDSPTALAFSVLVILVLNPLTIKSVSFQLSVGCIIGIFLFSGRIYDWITDRPILKCKNRKSLRARIIRFAAGTVAVSLGAGAVTMPLCAWHFQTISLIGLVTNLLTLWMVTIVFYGILGACVVGAFWTGGAMAIGWLTAWGIRYVTAVASLLARMPLAAIYVRSGYMIIWMLCFYVLLTVFLLSGRKRPVIFGCCVSICLCLALLASWLEPLGDAYRVTVLDVGQGQSVILQSQGKTFLVDCGGSSDRQAADIAAVELLSQGIRKVDGVIVTNYGRDYAGGIPYFLTRMECDAVYLPQTVKYRETAEKIAAIHPDVVMVSDRTEIRFGTTVLSLIPPPAPDRGNESSLCVLFQPENYDILLTGDRSSLGEHMLLGQTDLPDLELLVAGHHGAADVCCEALLEAAKPDAVVISAGVGNPHGYPGGALLQRLHRYGCDIYRTDLQGTIIYRR